MAPVEGTVRSRGETLDLLPQIVPGPVCLECDVCCRFPESDSFLRPYFTEEEIAEAVGMGVAPSWFSDPAGSQIAVAKDAEGEGYHCPAFDPTTSRCGVYDRRPLDCRLYPLALMWNAAGDRIVLGWDTKCPFMREAVPDAIRRHAARVEETLVQEPTLRTLARHPQLIGRFQDDVIVLTELPSVTERVRQAQPDRRLRPLRLDHAGRMTQALERSECRDRAALASAAFPYHYVWTTVLPYWWLEQDGVFFLFAQSPDGWFMPLPPIGSRPLADTCREAAALMRQWNGDSPVTRIENLSDRQKAALPDREWRWASKQPDYVYRAESLANLAGDLYKSQRALCNKAERLGVIDVRPYRLDDRTACRALFDRWTAQKQEGLLDTMGRYLLEDARAAHELAWSLGDRLGLIGRVVCVDGRVAGYTFGYRLTPETFAVLFEVADRSATGLAQYLFRDTCRMAIKDGAEFINAMDDSGLEGLRAAKTAYHPVALLRNWIASPVSL